MSDMLTGGQLVARMLKQEGVGTAFTLSGLHVAPIYAGCVEQGIRLVDTRHEQAAAHAADAWARLTRRAGVAIVTAGPGVTDAVTGVANACSANVPLVLLGGAAPTFNLGRGALQEMREEARARRGRETPAQRAMEHVLSDTWTRARDSNSNTSI